MTPLRIHAFRNNLLTWYAAHARPLPWRATRSPYAIWLSEVMLQQTTVAAVVPYYHRFLARFPTVQALAQADIQEVLHLWQGLGYYRRAHLLHATARAVATQHAGIFPDTEDALRRLPGFGPYTAAAVAAQAFNRPASVVDGNVERVIARQFAVATPLPAAKKQITLLAAQLADPEHPGAYANAIMELGATVCTPRNPLCLTCPVSDACAARIEGSPTSYPVKTPKKALPVKTGTAYVVTDAADNVWLRQRPPTGLLAGLWEVPHTGWESAFTLPPGTVKSPGVGLVRHTFTHFHLHLTVEHHASAIKAPSTHHLSAIPASSVPLPTLMRKVVQAGLKLAAASA